MSVPKITERPLVEEIIVPLDGSIVMLDLLPPPRSGHWTTGCWKPFSMCGGGSGGSSTIRSGATLTNSPTDDDLWNPASDTKTPGARARGLQNSSSAQHRKQHEAVPALESEPSESTWSSNEDEYDYNDDYGEDEDAIVSFQLYSPTKFLWHMAHLLISLILVHATVQGRRGRVLGKPQTKTRQASKVQGNKKPSTSSDVRSIPVL